MSIPEEKREQLQSLLRDVVTLNTDIGEAEKEFLNRFCSLKNKLSKIYCEMNGKLNSNNEKEKEI